MAVPDLCRRGAAVQCLAEPLLPNLSGPRSVQVDGAAHAAAAPGALLPPRLHPLAWRHTSLVFDLLFAAAARTLIELCRDPQHLGAEIGVTLVLHTWTRALTFHPHVHGILPGGGLARAPDPHHDRWVACDPEFFIHVDVCAPVLRGTFLDALGLPWRPPDWEPQGSRSLEQHPWTLNLTLN